MPPSPQRAQPLRLPCPVVKKSKALRGLYFGSSSAEALQTDVLTVFPPVENALSKRFPLFESILGTMYPIHECRVRVNEGRRQGDFLVAFQERPDLPPNTAIARLVPHASVCAEIVVMRSGARYLVLEMGGHLPSEAAKRAVQKFVLKYVAHHAQYRGKRNIPPLPTAIGFD